VEEARVAEVVGPSEAELLRFFRAAFEKLEEVKLDLANTHLSQLFEQDAGLAQLVAQHPADFVMLLNAADANGSLDGDDRHRVDDSNFSQFSSHTYVPSAAEGLQGLHRERGRNNGPNPAPEDGEEGEEEGEEEMDGRRGDAADGGLRRRPSLAADFGFPPPANEEPTPDFYSLPAHHSSTLLARASSTHDPPSYTAAYFGDGAAPELLRPQDLPPAQEVHSELMEAVMQQWLHTAAGQAAAQEAARLDLGAEEVGQFFHARMLQSLGRLRPDDPPEFQPDQLQLAVGHLTPDDEGAVERLTALGFTRVSAVEAYLACSRDEMLAANFLVDQ